MCCPAGEHVNTEGGKKLPTSSFPTIPNPPPQTSTRHLHMEGRRKGERRWSEADGEEEGSENANCREMEKKVLSGKIKLRGKKKKLF